MGLTARRGVRSGSTAKIAGVRAIARAFDILEALTEGQLSIGEIGKRIGLPKTTAHRILVTLEQRGIVVRSDSDGDFQLGPRLLHLGMHVKSVADLREAALPVMRELRDRFGETANLSIIVGNERLCIASIEGIYEVRSVGVVGQRSPLHSGAAARAILAFLPDDRIHRHLAEVTLARLTDQTITDPARLWDAIQEARRLGHVVTMGERTAGAMSVAAPIWNGYNEVIGSINVTGPATRMSTYPIQDLAAAVTEAGRTVSRALGHVSSTTRLETVRKGGT
jgi:DNA-binding IclR family transcriptional regulator